MDLSLRAIAKSIMVRPSSAKPGYMFTYLRVLVDWVRRYPATLPELSPLLDCDAEHVAETGWKI